MAENDEGFVFHDKRKVDPETGEVRSNAQEGAAESAPSEGVSGPPDADAAAFVDIAIAELTADLQRIQAEYSNYRKRVERDRSVARDNAIADVLNALLPALDDMQRAREHNEFTGALKGMGEAIEAVANRFGLETYGVTGEEFDPAIHEALTHTTADDAGENPITVVSNVYQVGYRHAGRVLRPARVGVQDRARH
jgi:molecular chaperone GrpE